MCMSTVMFSLLIPENVSGNLVTARIVMNAGNLKLRSEGMTVNEFVDHYRGICNAAAGWKDPDWEYRYNVVALDGQGTTLLKEVMNRVEEAIERNDAAQNREKCQDMLKRYASLGMIRQNGLSIRKYIYGRKENAAGRIVYQMGELTPSWIASLIPESVLSKAVHRKK